MIVNIGSRNFNAMYAQGQKLVDRLKQEDECQELAQEIDQLLTNIETLYLAARLILERKYR